MLSGIVNIFCLTYSYVHFLRWTLLFVVSYGAIVLGYWFIFIIVYKFVTLLYLCCINCVIFQIAHIRAVHVLLLFSIQFCLLILLEYLL